MKKTRIILTILSLIPLAYYSYLIFTQNLDDSYFFFAYNTIVIFSLPFLLSKISSSKQLFTYNSMILFLIYPTIYLLAFLIAKLTPIHLDQLLRVISILLILKWNTLIILLIAKIHAEELKLITKQLLHLLPIFIIYILGFLLIRNINSIVALDYLQHYSVSAKMYTGEALCLIPNQCSELFIQVGYSTIYHTILGFLTAFSNTNPVTAIFILDIVYPLFISVLVFNILKKFSKNYLFLSIMTLCSLFIFVNGAYETTFFIPQTLAFIFFLMALSIKKLNLKLLIGIALILIPTHFIIGTYLLVLLILKYFFVDKVKMEQLKVFYKYILIFCLFTPILLLIANSSGFSIETAIQGEATKIVGGVTNMPFPQNIFQYFGIWGGTGLFVLFAILFQKNKLDRWYIYSAIYLSITLCIFLLAPTYATKFLIGVGIFTAILILRYLKTLENNSIKILASILILISLLPTYYFNKLDYLSFYKQNDNITSAVGQEDEGMLEYLRQRDADCIFVSDPLTQILIESLGEQNTARAQYILPESRKKIFEFVQEPSETSYENLRNIEELKNRDLCFVHSARLNTSLQKEDIYWLFHMYSITIDNSIKLDNTDELKSLMSFMNQNQYNVIYHDTNFVVFSQN